MLRPFGIFLLCVCEAALFAPARAVAAPSPQAAPSQAPATIVVPRKVVAGERATLAVLDADGRLVAGAAVEVAGVGEVKTDATGRATFTAPVAASLLVDLRNGGAPASAPILPAIAGTGEAAPGVLAARIDFAPGVIAVGEPFEIGGSGFSGDATQDRLTIAAQPALVLAASPLSVVTLVNSSAPVGDTQLSMTVVGERAGSRPITLVALDLAGPATPLVTGETAALGVRVAGSAKPVLVQVSNSTPEVIELTGGNIRRLVTSGGTPNSVTLQVVSIGAGDYSVRLHLVPVTEGQPDENTARLELIGARGIADAKWQKRLDHILLLMKREPANLAGVRQEISKQLQEHPPGRVEDSLRVVAQLLATG